MKTYLQNKLEQNAVNLNLSKVTYLIIHTFQATAGKERQGMEWMEQPKTPKRRQIDDFLCLFFLLVVLTLVLWTLHFSYSFSSVFCWALFAVSWESLHLTSSVLSDFLLPVKSDSFLEFFSRVKLFFLACLCFNCNGLQRFENFQGMYVEVDNTN